MPDFDRIGRVAAKVIGTVAELRKRLSDPVAKRNEVVAVIESREVADAKSEYLATRVHFELQQTCSRAHRRSAGQDRHREQFLRARQRRTRMRKCVETARQKLFTLDWGWTRKIAALPDQPAASLSRQEIRAPIAGRVAERRVDLGAPVGREGQESELYVIVDLSELWVDLAVAPRTARPSGRPAGRRRLGAGGERAGRASYS